jgi:UTP--glucose-1-phosphate uridylyltransferase
MIRKSVIPAAGLGTRMLPAAKAVAKELLPILDRPTIQYVVEEAAKAGITDVILVSSPAKRAVEQHFQIDEALEERLRRGGKQKLLDSVRDLSRRVRVHAVDQPEQRGLGHAVAQARIAVGDEPFLCMLGDAVFSGESPSRELVKAHREFGAAVIGLEEVPLEKVGRYGVIGGTPVRDGVYKIDALVEKPRPEQAPSRLAIAARYVLTPAIFDCLDRVAPGALGEIQLTDALKLLLEREAIHGVVLRGTRHDIGNPIDWLKTNLIFASRDPAIWNEIAPLLGALREKK